ncbi:MAG: GntR family transcriptional regulator [Lachnospiraceae bacterium]|nr:GntR family transcriptional regulator [Lachnospiraceae bacterium]MBP3506796.1 GntR family transcriptional regulator [Lachnospiraceae bacterium]
MELKFDVNEYLPLRDVVFQTLRQAIITGEIPPGERLMEIPLAKKLGVSRTPVREAIRMLELEGLVVMIPRRGAEVARITEKDLRDALEVRCALEEQAVILACQRITREEKEKLKAACIAFREAISTKLVPSIVDGDVAFHDAILEATHNQRLVMITHNLWEQVYRYRVEYVKDFSYHDVLVSEHDAITNAILMGDGEQARTVMRKHIYNQESIVISNVQSQMNK